MERPLRALGSTARPLVLAAIAMFLTSSVALGQPITYTGFIITNGQLGDWSFYNARVILTFESDTKYVQTINPTCVMRQNVVYNPTGVATVTIVDHQRVVTARFARNQIFVSFDQKAGGVGFGSYAPGGVFVNDATCANAAGLTPAYPLGLYHGTMDSAGCSGCTTTSSNQNAFPNNLQGNVGFSGTGYTCVGVPTQKCDPATFALKTDQGDLFLSQPYQDYDSSDTYLVSLNGAFFFQQTGEARSPLPRGVLAPSSSISTGSITYHLLLVSDVSLNGELFQNASIHLSFQSHTSHVTALSGGGVMNAQGVARVEIKKGERSVSATFAPHQLYVYSTQNPAPISAGFASYAGGLMYPAALAPTFVHSDPELLADFGGSDLKSETLLADYVSSCTNFDFIGGFCADLTSQPRLITDKGDFYLYEAYNKNGFNDPTSLVRSSDSWGLFWATFEAEESGD